MSDAKQTPQPPVMTTVDVERIRAVFPAEMLALPQWVPYRMKWSDSMGKFDKIPMNPNTGCNAKSNLPSTWGRFDIAVKLALNRKLGGVGFVFSREDPYVGIDLDKCMNGADEIEPWASEIIAELNSYTEKSPSGRGYHILGRGQLPPRGRRKGQIEMYDTGRFFTVTGLVEGPGQLRDIQTELTAFHARLFNRKNQKRSEPRHDFDTLVSPALSDSEVIEVATRATNGAKFDTLWRGAWQGLEYPSQSEADQALCNKLAWYVRYDPLRVDALFRKSGLFRPDKWDKPHYADGRSYGQVTVDKSVEGHSPSDGYRPTEKGKRREPKTFADERPAIVVNRQLIHVLEDTWKVVHNENRRRGGPILFQRTGQLVRIRQDKDAPPYIAMMSKEATTTFLFERADWVIWGEKSIKPSKPHPDIVAALLCDPDPALPQLALVAQSPFFSSDCKLIASDGYHPDARTWLKLSPDLQGIVVPDNPSPEDVRIAVSLFLDDLLVDFPFTEKSDRANCLGVFLLPFVRNIVNDVTPLHLFEAPTPGSGKGLLVSLLSIVASGDEVVVQVFPYEEEELRKRLSSELLKGRFIIAFDNADSKRQLASATLAAVLTTTVWGDRELGRISDITLHNNSIWVMTGNNLSLSSELADRTIRIRIDPKIERPRERDPKQFKHHPIKPWVRQHRRELITAALTMIKAWIQVGMPFSGKEYGSFEAWSRVVGGILENAGVEGFMGNRKEFFEHVDTDLKMWHDFVDAWWERFADNPVQAKLLNDLCEEQELMMPVRRDGTERSQVTRLGNALKRARDSVKGNFRIHTDVYVVNNSGSHRNNGYRLSHVECDDGVSHIGSQTPLSVTEDIDLASINDEAPF